MTLAVVVNNPKMYTENAIGSYFLTALTSGWISTYTGQPLSTAI